ncbi:MAG TPA: 2-oxoacid:acceptor oxidoreductase family protein [Nitrospirota bacterium]
MIFAGSGGQGVLLAGKLLAWAGMLGGKQVTCFPSYGAEMRGGTANCTVIISDEEIGSPVVDSVKALVAFNQASAEKFAHKISRGGIMVVNSSLVKNEVKRAGVKVIKVPANDVAEGLGNARAVNMVMLGAYLGATGVVSLLDVAKAMEDSLPARNKALLPINMAALKKGFEMVSK